MGKFVDSNGTKGLRETRNPLGVLERPTGFEPATSSLGSWHSATELRPRSGVIIDRLFNDGSWKSPAHSRFSRLAPRAARVVGSTPWAITTLPCGRLRRGQIPPGRATAARGAMPGPT